jgi:tRNA U34 5-carboxymethylaminomethyl modifying enzyme MnmG/GidA
MSYPALSHLEYRLTADGDHTHLRLRHRAIGLIPSDHLAAMTEGMEPWSHTLQRVREVAERRTSTPGARR